MLAQTVIWTLLPNGSGGDGAHCSVHVAPRLSTDTAHPTLAAFPDWLDWPKTLAGITFTLSSPALGAAIPATVVSTADSARWKALFPPTTPVRANHTYQGADNRVIWSYPVSWITGFLADRWGRYGTQNPNGSPAYTDLVDGSGFGAIGFENPARPNIPGQDTSGPDNKSALLAKLQSTLSTGAGTGPDQWARRYGASWADDKQLGTAFLEAQHFHQRGLPQSRTGASPGPSAPDLDFHDAVSLARDFPALQRLLGLVVDLRITDPAFLAALGAASATPTTVQVAASWPTPALATVTSSSLMNCSVGPSGAFQAQPGAGVLAGRMLALPDTGTFQVASVDPDSGALLARQFADNVTRSRDAANAPLSLLTPAAYALPALRTQGISVTQLNRANTLAHVLAGQAALNASTFDGSGNKLADQPIYGKDVVRGYRWDVWDDAVGAWFSLMQRTGTYLFPGSTDPAKLAYPVQEESAAIMSPTTSGNAGDSDLYVHESLLRWNGWSLAVRRSRPALDASGAVTDPGSTTDPRFPFSAGFTVPAGTLPRLRFGRTYRLRARAVDIAGNSEPFTQSDLGGATPPFVYRRFEPVPPPQVLGRALQGPGESDHTVAIRSENLSSPGAAPSDRHVAPARMAVAQAEQHGLLDDPGTGHPLRSDLATYNTLTSGDADAQGTSSVAKPQPNGGAGAVYYDTDNLQVTWLPEVLTRTVAVQDLPAPAGPFVVPMQPNPWPQASAFRLRLAAGAPGWTWDATNRLLTVSLDVGDVYKLRLSSRFGPDKSGGDTDLALLGVPDWILNWAQAHGYSPAQIDALRTAMREGQHAMVTPWQEVLLVHAVRTPLFAPSMTLRILRNAGDTFATLVPLGVQFSQKSTGTIDMLAAWTMNIDNGPGTAPPTTQSFTALAHTYAIGRIPGPLSDPGTVLDSTGRHEFADTKYRSVVYTAQATSAFVEYFRQQQTLSLTTPNPAKLAAPVAPSTVKVTDTATGKQLYRPVPAGSDGRGDYQITPDGTGFLLAPGSAITLPANLTISYVAPPIATANAIGTYDVPSSARPAAPKPLYVVPTFKWITQPTVSIRQGGGLRIYLERPWWSSGDGEQLAVVCWRQADNPGAIEPDQALGPYLSRWGLDPTTSSNTLAPVPTPASFVNGGAVTGIPLTEVPGTFVDLATFTPAYADDRDLWFCDVRVAEQKAVWPFLRLALARYQPNSVAGCRLSKIVPADVIQIAPTRTVSIIGAGVARTVNVVGRTIIAGPVGPGPTQVRVSVEHALPGVPDPDLGWQAYDMPAVTLRAGLSDQNLATWSAALQLPADPATTPMRLVVEEVETHPLGGAQQGTGERVVHVDTLPITP